MGIQTMASQGGGGGQRSQSHNNLVRQNSLYSLTLNEVENHLGEPLHSMNLEELLKGLDANQEVDGPTNQYNASSSGLQRQGSITMPRSLRDKTVDEVWREIQQGHVINKESEDNRAFGQMTLEDFLAKAGVVPEAMGVNLNVNEMIGEGTQYGQQHWLNPYQAVQQPMGFGTMYHEGQMSMSPRVVGGMFDMHTSGRKRAAASSDLGDKGVDRRQKRMIKNRESAARSRARKQAYTNELENKVSRLEEENERLKKQLELDRILNAPPPEPEKNQPRPTCSAPF